MAPETLCATRPSRLPGRRLTAGDVLRKLPAKPTAADVAALEGDILRLPGTEREALRHTLAGRVLPEDMITLRGLFGRPTPPTSVRSWWPPASAADLMVAGRAMARLFGWNYDGPWPRQVVQQLAEQLLALEPAERWRAAGLLTGTCGLPDAKAVLALAERADDPPGTDDEGALEAYQGLNKEIRRLLVSDNPRRQAAGAVRAAEAGMSPAALEAVLQAAGASPADAKSLAAWAVRQAARTPSPSPTVYPLPRGSMADRTATEGLTLKASRFGRTTGGHRLDGGRTANGVRPDGERLRG